MNEPAFPINGGIAENQYNGMTLRDYFAAKAMQGAVAGLTDDRTLLVLNAPEVVKRAYQIADAMLAARNEEQTK